MAFISLGPADDFFIDSDESHNIYGDAGDDTIIGAGGNDLIHGGKGDDWIRGDTGNDFLSGAAGNDVVLGGGGFDTIFGRAGSDWLAINQGVVDGGPGDDFLVMGDFRSGSAWDPLNGPQTTSTLAKGGAGADTVDFYAVGAVFDPDGYHAEVLDFGANDKLNLRLVAQDIHTILDDATTKDWVDMNNDGSISVADGYRAEIGWGVTTSADGKGIDIHISGDVLTLHGVDHIDYLL